MTTPTQMGAEPRPDPAPRQQEAASPRALPRDRAVPEEAPQQMGGTLLRDWASI